MKMEIVNKEEDFFCVLNGDWPNVDSFISWYNDQEAFIAATLKKHGVIRFQHTGMTTNEDFQKFVAGINIRPIDYVDGNSPRTKLSSSIYTSTEYPAEATISLHNELSYSDYFPKKIFFYCLTPATEGGETTILNGNAFLHKLNPEIMGDFFDRKIKYIRNLHGGKGVGPSWQETYETDDKEKIAAFCEANNIRMIWKEKDKLRLEQLRPTTVLHEVTGKRVWFNQADQFHPSNNAPEVYEALKMLYEKNEFPLYVSYEDDSDIPEAIFDHVRATAKEHTIAMPWQKGDLMLVDNMAAMHGRNPFAGERKVLVSMV